MKKILLFLVLFAFTGCSIQYNPRKTAYPFSIYIFKNDSNFKEYTKSDKKIGVALLSSTPYKSATVELESGLDVKLFVAINVDDDLATALGNLHIEGCNHINYSYIKSLIIHHNILQDEILFEKTASFVYFSEIINPSVFLYTTDKNYIDIYNIYSSNGKSPYFNMINTLIPNEDFDRIKQITLNSFLRSYYDNFRSVYIIDLDVDEYKDFVKDEEATSPNPQYKINGLYFTTLNSHLLSFLEIDKLKGFGWYLKSTNFLYSDNEDKHHIYIDKVSHNYDIKNNIITFEIDANINNSIFDTNIISLKSQLETKIYNEIVSTYYYAKEKDIDIYHTIDTSKRKNKKIETDTKFNISLNIINQKILFR